MATDDQRSLASDKKKVYIYNDLIPHKESYTIEGNCQLYTNVKTIANLWYFFIWNVENITLNLHTIYHIEFFCMFLESCVYTAKNKLPYSGTFSIIHNFIWPVLMHNIKCTIVKFMQIKKAIC